MKRQERECRYGHGNLSIQDGEWGIPGVGWMPQKRDISRLVPAMVPVQNNEVFVLKIATCPTCGYVELFDEGSAST